MYFWVYVYLKTIVFCCLNWKVHTFNKETRVSHKYVLFAQDQDAVNIWQSCDIMCSYVFSAYRYIAHFKNLNKMMLVISLSGSLVRYIYVVNDLITFINHKIWIWGSLPNGELHQRGSFSLDNTAQLILYDFGNTNPRLLCESHISMLLVRNSFIMNSYCILQSIVYFRGPVWRDCEIQVSVTFISLPECALVSDQLI